VKLRELIEDLSPTTIEDLGDIDAVRVQSDSRAVQAGDVFVAVRGISSDGHDFVSDAVARGAVAVVSERHCDTGKVANVVVQDSGKALAKLSAMINGNPGDRLRLVGVTGTNGKTSTTHLLRAMCRASSWGNLGVIGTVGHGSGDVLEAAAHTTPEPVALHRLLGDMEENGCVGVVMEVSSHAVRQQRIWGLDFEIGMLTNITRDHLDYHPTFEDYIDAKREFCYSLVSDGRRKPAGTLIYSRDDAVARDIGDGFPGQKRSVSIEEPADVFATDVDASLKGTAFDLHLGGEIISVSMQLLAPGAGSFRGPRRRLQAGRHRRLFAHAR
jgi:UDP-N-acetylmuramoyl-L-alanyl-D-glutamate--2,6-diaminopimelate ligase